MSTAQEIVTQAFRLLGALDISEREPSPAEMDVALTTFTRMVDSWQAQNLNISTQTLSGAIVSGQSTVMDLPNPYALAPGLNVTGTGIPDDTRILSIDSTKQITLTKAATADGTVTLAFTALPFEPKYERGVVALLALDLAPLISKTDIPRVVLNQATDGWANLTANFMVTPPVTFDRDLLFTSIRRDSGVVTGNG